MRNGKDNLIVKLSFEFALKIISYSEEIRQINRFEMASQIFRSGTSIGANIREAQNAESKADLFINSKSQLKKLMKLSIGYPYVRNRNFIQTQVKNYIKKYNL